MGLSKNQIKLVNKLQQKKHRILHNLFVAEGTKVVNEFLKSAFEPKVLFATNEFVIEAKHTKNITFVSEGELLRISNLKTPNKVLGLFKIPAEKPIQTGGLILALDQINDPGNLGTIIRLCDWFGVEQLVCSKNTVDCYNPKVIQSSMGSLSRVKINYVDLLSYIKSVDAPVFTADISGNNIYETKLPNQAVLIMGNEANGISQKIQEAVLSNLSIPRFGNRQETESLNVATATAILLSEFRRGGGKGVQ